jgi:hypothetical protein
MLSISVFVNDSLTAYESDISLTFVEGIVIEQNFEKENSITFSTYYYFVLSECPTRLISSTHSSSLSVIRIAVITTCCVIREAVYFIIFFK